MIIDSHCHLHDPAFGDLRETLSTALAHDVWGVVAVGCDPETNARTLAAAGRAPKSVWAGLGFHPDWAQLGEAELERVEQQLAEHHHHVVALGEVGLPWYSLADAADPVAPELAVYQGAIPGMLRRSSRATIWRFGPTMTAGVGAASRMSTMTFGGS